jgi:hypothetical protein
MGDETRNLLEKLIDKTSAGKISWKSTYEPGTFVASVEGEFGLELSRSPGPFISLKMFDTTGNQLYSTTGPALTGPLTSNHPTFKLSQLYGLAKDRALDNHGIVEQLARAEKLLDAL